MSATSANPGQRILTPPIKMGMIKQWMKYGRFDRVANECFHGSDLPAVNATKDQGYKALASGDVVKAARFFILCQDVKGLTSCRELFIKDDNMEYAIRVSLVIDRLNSHL